MAPGAHAQRVKNLAYYKDHGEQCRKSIARLTTQLRSVMRMARTRLPVPAKEGELVPGMVWRALKVNDPRVFYQRETVSSPDFTVDLMLDASASRGEYQQVIASQAYVIAESLRQCGIPYQVYSFCTLRNYTVLTLFKDYADKKRCTNIFNYVATGWNRDGLALRGARQLMGDFTRTKKILIMLTDGEPNDDKPLVGDGLFSSSEYRDEKAVANTADEAAALRREESGSLADQRENQHIMKDAGRSSGRTVWKSGTWTKWPTAWAGCSPGRSRRCEKQCRVKSQERWKSNAALQCCRGRTPGGPLDDRLAVHSAGRRACTPCGFMLIAGKLTSSIPH